MSTNFIPDLEQGDLSIRSPTTTASNPSTLKPKCISHFDNNSPNRTRGKRRLPGWLSRRKKATVLPVQVRKLESHSKGYPSVAAFLDSDEGFMLYRRFGWLQSRLLLDKQEELRLLENKLIQLDQREADVRESIPMRRDAPPDQRAPRKDLLQKIEDAFCSYSQLMVAAQQLVAFNKPSNTDYRSVQQHIRNKKPLAKAEAQWIEWKEDIVTLRPGREHAWLDVGIERILRFFHGPIVERFFCPPKEQRKSLGDEIYYDRGRINRLAVSIIICMIGVLLIVPVYILYHLIADYGNGKAYAAAIGVLLAFTLAFSAVLSLFTRARRHEILAAAAGYCAVLVVFLGNVGKNTSA